MSADLTPSAASARHQSLVAVPGLVQPRKGDAIRQRRKAVGDPVPKADSPSSVTE